MRRHDLDTVSLIAGLVFFLTAVAYLVAASTDLDVSFRWVAPAALVGLGVAGLAGVLRAGRTEAPTDVREKPERTEV